MSSGALLPQSEGDSAPVSNVNRRRTADLPPFLQRLAYAASMWASPQRTSVALIVLLVLLMLALQQSAIVDLLVVDVLAVQGEKADYHQDGADNIILLVQGPRAAFDEWYQRVKNVSSTTLIYASYDAPIEDDLGCVEDKCLFLPNSTWTEGRDRLSLAALCQEQQREATFKYWVFADDDVILECPAFPGIPANAHECWNLFTALLKDNLTAPVVAIRGSYDLHNLAEKERHGFVLTDSYDAILNAFHRDHVPLLLPSVDLPLGSSWWESQAVHFLFMRSCYPDCAVSPLAFQYRNPGHREYPRGLNTTLQKYILHKEYDPYGVFPVDVNVDKTVAQFEHVSGPYSSVEAVNADVTFKLQRINGSCSHFARRFHDWVASAASCYNPR